MKDETAGVAIKEFAGLKQNIFSFSVYHCSDHKKAKDVNKNSVATRIHNEHKDVLLNKKSLRYSINKFQNKDHRIRAYEIKLYQDDKNIILWC